MTTEEKLSTLSSSLTRMLLEKNKRYGNSALSPINVFTTHKRDDNPEGVNGILTRLDDKLSRVKSSPKLRKNDIADLLGYLSLLCVGMDWLYFEDLLD